MNFQLTVKEQPLAAFYSVFYLMGYHNSRKLDDNHFAIQSFDTRKWYMAYVKDTGAEHRYSVYERISFNRLDELLDHVAYIGDIV